jgi:hypothetical protein
MAEISLRNILLGFLAAAIAVVTVHQLIFAIATAIGLVQVKTWSFDPVGPLALPGIVNNMFWGGLWGALFTLIWTKLPGNSMPVRGAIFGFLGPILTGRWLLVPLIKGEALFAGLVPASMLTQVVVGSCFGATLAWLYGKLSSQS